MPTSNKKSKRSSFVALLLIAAIAITGVFAFLTATTETKINKFTVGNISVTLDEGGWNPDDAKVIEAGKVMVKEPKIINDGANDAYGFIVVSVPKADVVVTDDYGNKSDSAVNELFSMIKIVDEDTDATEVIDTTADHLVIGDWTLVEKDTDTSETLNYYVFSYASVIGASEETSTLFDEVKFANVTEDFAKDEKVIKNFTENEQLTLTITATAVAIQADEEINSSATAWAALKADKDFGNTGIYPALIPNT